MLLQLMFVAAVRMDWVQRLFLLGACLNEVPQIRTSWAAGARSVAGGAALEGDKAHAIAWSASSSQLS